MLKNSQLPYMNEMYDKYKDYFQTSLHSTLWHLFVDWDHSKIHAFVNNYTANGNILGIATANESGYTPTLAYFKSMSNDEVNKILSEMNADIFGHTEETAFQILCSSMAGEGVKRKQTFTVNVTWTMFGFHEIEAESKEEALRIAQEMNLPKNGEYSKRSAEFEIDEEN